MSAQDEYAAEVIAANPWSYYLLNEASGMPQDSSGNGRHCTQSLIIPGGSGSFTYGLPGPFDGSSSIRFTANGSDIWFQGPGSGGIGDTCVTLQCWVMVESISDGDEFGQLRMYYAHNIQQGIQVSTVKPLGLAPFLFAYPTHSVALALNTWYFLRFDRKVGGTGDIWVNDDKDSPAGSASIATPSSALGIGLTRSPENAQQVATATVRLSNFANWRVCPAPPLHYPQFIPQYIRRIRRWGVRQVPTVAPPSSYQEILDAHATYADVQSAYASYDEMASGP
jgi:hypothetical protein